MDTEAYYYIMSMDRTDPNDLAIWKVTFLDNDMVMDELVWAKKQNTYISYENLSKFHDPLNWLDLFEDVADMKILTEDDVFLEQI